MDDSERTQALLTEIRDLQKEQLAEYRRHAARHLELAESSVAKATAMQRLYKRVVFVGALLVTGLLLLLWQLLSA